MWLLVVVAGCGNSGSLREAAVLDPGSKLANGGFTPGADFLGVGSQKAVSRNFVLTTSEFDEDHSAGGQFSLELE